jgi:hypothetical protein
MVFDRARFGAWLRPALGGFYAGKSCNQSHQSSLAAGFSSFGTSYSGKHDGRPCGQRFSSYNSNSRTIFIPGAENDCGILDACSCGVLDDECHDAFCAKPVLQLSKPGELNAIFSARERTTVLAADPVKVVAYE